MGASTFPLSDDVVALGDKIRGIKKVDSGVKGLLEKTGSMPVRLAPNLAISTIRNSCSQDKCVKLSVQYYRERRIP
jgi:hypothetical protein